MKQCGFKAQLCYYNTAVRIIILFADFIKAPQSTSMKKFSSKSKISKILQLQQENEADLHAIRNGLKKHIIEEKGFVFSLSQFEGKNQEIKEANLNRVELAPHSLTQRKAPLDEQEEESKRKMIYGSESYKEKFEEGFSKQVEKNNHLFSMVFLGKSKLSQTPSISFVPIKDNLQTQRRSRAQKPSFQDPQPLKISDFELGKKLGAGKFGQVFIARHKGTNFMCALKKIQKQNVDSKVIVQVVRQIKIQSFLSHPNIVKMFAFFADKSYIYLVLQLCFSGQLYSFLKRRRRISEDTTKNIVQQVCRALDYMHENQIIHRDLKPENIIFHCGLVKICDFGWSISTNTMRDTFCGTPLYVSPEILKRKTYNNKIDVWSVGILTYELLFGRVPFEITTERDFLKIVRDQIRFSRATKISEEARHFISACLQKDPRDRFTLPELLEHPFLAHLENTSMLEMY